jgi:hypothetical protein
MLEVLDNAALYHVSCKMLITFNYNGTFSARTVVLTFVMSAAGYLGGLVVID